MNINKVSVSLGSFVHAGYLKASKAASDGISVYMLGEIKSKVLQLCPQNSGMLDEQIIDGIVREHPEKEIRLHANVALLSNRILMDIIDFDEHHPYWKRLRAVTRHAGAKVYSAHAGMRRDKTMRDVLDQQARLTDFLGIPVAIEGHYPSRDNQFLASSWDEWAMMYASGMPFVVDVSHAAIIANLSRKRNDALIIDMLSSVNCLECHISGNNEVADQHTPMSGNEWWWPLLAHLTPDAEVFYEGVFRLENVR